MKWILRLLLVTIVIAHMALVVTNVISMFVLPFWQPWYVCVPVVTYLVNLTFGSNPCPMTRLENRIRRGLGMPEIKHFIGHYIVWPLKRKFRKKRVAVVAAEI